MSKSIILDTTEKDLHDSCLCSVLSSRQTCTNYLQTAEPFYKVLRTRYCDGFKWIALFLIRGSQQEYFDIAILSLCVAIYTKDTYCTNKHNFWRKYHSQAIFESRVLLRRNRRINESTVSFSGYGFGASKWKIQFSETTSVYVYAANSNKFWRSTENCSFVEVLE